MKKLFFILAVGFVLGVSITSCKSHETCPAYGSVEVEASEAGDQS